MLGTFPASAWDLALTSTRKVYEISDVLQYDMQEIQLFVQWFPLERRLIHSICGGARNVGVNSHTMYNITMNTV